MYAGSNPEQELLEARYHELTQAVRELSKQLAIQCAELKAYQRLSPSSEDNVKKAKRRISEAEAKARKTMANMKERDADSRSLPIDRKDREIFRKSWKFWAGRDSDS